MNDRYRLYFEELPWCVSVLDPDLRILDTNRRFREAFGDPAGTPCYALIRHRSEKCPDCIVEKTFQDGQGTRREETVILRDGDERPVEVLTRPIPDERGRITAVMVAAVERTELLQAQERLTAQGQLVGAIAHGIKGRLTGVDGGIYLVNSGQAKDNPERVRKGWAMVQRNVERIRGMVLDVLYYAKDRVPLRETVQVRDLVKDLVQNLEKRTEPGVKIHTRVTVDTGDFFVDPRAIRSLLANVLEHCLEACQANEETQSRGVSLLVAEEADQMVFRVGGPGTAGFDGQSGDQAFSPRMPSLGIAGTGPGLAVAQKIAQSHGVTMEGNAAPGACARFLIRIPRRAPGGSPERG